MYTYTHPRPAVTVDIVLIRLTEGNKQVLLIRRIDEPFAGKYALPGGFVEIGESLEVAAERELSEETGVQNLNLKQIQTFSDPDRDPRGWVISTAFGALLMADIKLRLKAGSEVSEIKWCDLDDLPPLAFDHQEIIAAGLLFFGQEITSSKGKES